MKKTSDSGQWLQIIIATLVLVLGAAGCALEQPTVPDAAIAPEAAVFDEIEAPIYARGVSKLGSLEFTLLYEPAVLELIKVEKGPLADHALIRWDAEAPGRVWTGIVSANGISGDGPVAIASFRITGEGDMGTALTLQNVSAHHVTTLLDLPAQASEGSFLVNQQALTVPTLAFTP